ncbi:MAG: histidine phosphatase family protein [Atopobiaceae bacterium]|jgi:phosphohistidine phosphatase SixA|nr:histidine phosphatase family protein [Atopobiaceae bacterium]MCH4180861.1 histidine phosphatase family protein [Atopobiaceae bacterium]MCH4213466.1 histidine phosphatase family protein [Atopobiaceae bacterium]MCH4277135.1 histidine phosphatase family protein [Atopobiaceae bacterium]MCI1226442.1 histidine phosphatase family protein [Atopobiaceae bacterium]
MSITLVLVRHGKAEKKQPEQVDLARSLTPEGTVALTAGFPRAFSLLGNGERAQAEIWTSAAVRACQTADIAASAIGLPLGAAELHDCLTNQDVGTFMVELSQRIAKAPGTVVCVGHVPFMDEVSGLLCGSRLPFSCGGVAAFQIDRPFKRYGGDEVPGRLLWFVQGPMVG